MRTQSYTHFGDPGGMTYGVQMLLVVNIAAFIIDWLIFPLRNFLALGADWLTTFRIWELITYQFLHQGPMHLLANMLGLFFLGPEVERGLGTNRFFTLYFLSGVLGGLGWSILAPNCHSCVGASGAVFGVLGAYAALYPDRELYIWGVLPVKAWLLVLIFGAYELSHVLDGPGGAIANAAHLGGGIAGTIYALVIDRPHIVRNLKRKFGPKPKPPVSRGEVDRILDKAANQGIHSLSPSEREILKNASKQ